MATRFLKISSNGNKILKSKLMTAPSSMIIFNFSIPFSIVLEDVYVTGFLAKHCQMTVKNSVHFQYMGMENYCKVDPYKDVVIHRVDIEIMHKRIMGIPVEKSNQVKERICLEHL